MKATGMKYFSLLIALLAIFSFTSCEDEIENWFDDDHYSPAYYEKTRYLCSRSWVTSWRNQAGKYCTQYLDFYEDRIGEEHLIIEDVPGGCILEETKISFHWNWDNVSQTCIRLDYGRNDIEYLEKVRLGSNCLKGWFTLFEDYVTYDGVYD